MLLYIRFAVGLYLLSLYCLPAKAGIGELIPKPQCVEMYSGRCMAKSFRTEGLYLQEELREVLMSNGYSLDSKSPVVARTAIVPSLPKVYYNKEEAYRLRIQSDGIYIDAIERTGLFRGLQTLNQLLVDASGSLPVCDIIDWPAFRMRGIMHDVGRSFIPISELKKQLKLFAQYKINTFHWHLTEHQAWRLESRRYPQLNEARTMTRMPGKYYTLKEVRELADYCRSLRITLIPELDMPGHSTAFERAMGFGMQTPQGKQVLKDVLRELVEAIEVPYIHIGTDEVTFSDKTFVPELVAYVRSLGRKVVSWNPGWSYRSGEIDMLHLWSSRGKGMYGTPSIDSRLHYINHYDLFADIQMLYSSKVLEVSASNTNVMGAILAVWNDRYIPRVEDIMQENSVYPNMMALAERAWRGGGAGYFDAPTAALSPKATNFTRDEFIDFERRMLWHKDRYFQTEPFPYVRQSHATWYISSVYDNQGHLNQSFAPEELYLKAMRHKDYAPPVSIRKAHLPYDQYTLGSGAYLRHVWGKTCYGLIPEAKENSTVYATAWVYSDRVQDAGLLVETQNYSRSEADLPPKQGTWDYKGSRLWFNGQEVSPPHWTSTHTEKSNEIPLGNENASVRPPISVRLNKGWNQLLIKLPIGRFSLPEIRLNKWMFAVAIVTPDGRDALPSIRYANIPIES